MTPERWQRVESLAQAALEREPADRAAFLDDSCGDDAELRGEVESLLGFHRRAEEEDFIGRPPGEVAAELLAGWAETLAGRALGHYLVECELGRGGMGEVYLARDTRLDRPVALKLLSSSFTSDPDRVRRFRREARAVSLLNHPHILTVHEVGEAEGRQFIVTEYVEGETLRDLLSRGPLTPGRALDIAVQAASALAAAHEAGIVHRDVKPDNVMVRTDGYVKVLDFGLAKLDRRGGPGGSPESMTLNKLSTSPGLVMGTVTYMSPEQARGARVDARTDVWSLGVVLYEMVTGRKPFDGETASDTIVSILEREPQPLSEHAPDAPVELEQIVTKALRKDREERYATMREMLDELREAREEVTFHVRQELHSTDGGGSSLPASVAAAQGRRVRRWGRVARWVGALVVALSALGFGVYQYVKSRHAPRTPPVAKMTRITAHGKISQVAISPDGKYMAYAAGPLLGQQSLWVMQTGTRSHAQIVPPGGEVTYLGLTFSPEGDYIYYFIATRKKAWLGELYRVPTLGGTPKRLLWNIDSAVTFSPDGRRIAFVRNVLEGKPMTESRLMVANADGTGEQVLATRQQPDYFWGWGWVKISWSPDGETIACPAGRTGLAFGNSIEVVGVSVKDGAQRSLTRRRWAYVWQVAWLGDGSGLVMVASEQPWWAPAQLWHVSYPEGSARRLTNDLNNYTAISVTADSSTIAAVQGDQLSNIWVAPDADAARARQITDSRYDGHQGIGWTPDGRIVYCSYVSGNADIWIMDADGGNRKRLTDDASWDAWPSVSADGRYVVYQSYQADKQNIWRMDIDGGNAVQLTDASNVTSPQFSPDGRWVYYISHEEGTGGMGDLWKVPIEGGEPVLVVDGMTAFPMVSPDQKSLAYLYFDPQVNPQGGVAIAPIEGGPPVKRLETLTDTAIRWTPDGRAFAYLDDRNMNVWAQPIGGGKPVQVTDFKSDQTFWFAYSHNGKQLALARGSLTSDVVLITDFK